MKKINLVIITATIVVVTSLIMHMESEIQSIGDSNFSSAIFWMTAVIGSIAAVIVWFGATKILEDRKDVQYKIR